MLGTNRKISEASRTEVTRSTVFIFVLFALYFAYISFKSLRGVTPYHLLGFALLFMFIMAKPMIGLMLVVFLIPLKVKFLYAISATEVVGFMTGLSWFLNTLSKRDKFIIFDWFERTSICLLSLMLISMAVNGSFAKTNLIWLISYLSLLMFYLAIVSILDSYEKILAIMNAFVFSGVVSSLFALYKTHSLMEVFSYTKAARGLSKEPIGLAFATGILIVYLIVRIIREKRLMGKILPFLIMLLFLTGIVLSLSRSGLVLITGSLLVFALLERKQAKLAIMIMIFIIIVGNIIFALLPQDVIVERFDTLRQLQEPAEMEDPSMSTRYHYISVGLDSIAENPLFGAGAFTEYIIDPDTGWNIILHNGYLQLAYESGIPALIVYLALYFFAIRQQFQLRSMPINKNNTNFLILNTTLLCGFFTILIFFCFMSGAFYKMVFIWFGLGVAFYRVAKAEQDKV